MKILAIEKEHEGVELKNEESTLKQEAHRVYELYLSGFLREIYFNEEHCAVLILECKDKEEAIELLNTLPLVNQGMIEFEVTVLTPYSGYRRIMT
ncbi:MAG: hypothetical protein JXB49_09755 [Bacteroidales bacterium]|nr:hypothetical protein [Bacteroidales bacterium]